MTTITAKLVADSITEYQVRIRSFECVYPAFFHQDVMTHRRFGRSALSTRALPSREMRRRIRQDMATPTYWGLNQPGMQAENELRGWQRRIAQWAWAMSGHSALLFANIMSQVNSAKQNANMPLWPFMHFKTLITTTDMANFYALRNHAAARPELQTLAKAMYSAEKESTPRPLAYGQWHLPYILPEEWAAHSIDRLLVISTSRCARLSYDRHTGGRASFEEEQVLFGKLLGSQPLHASPAEHQATPDRRTTNVVRFNDDGNVVNLYRDWDNPQLHGNLVGAIQHRKLLEGEEVNDYNPEWKINRDQLYPQVSDRLIQELRTLARKVPLAA